MKSNTPRTCARDGSRPAFVSFETVIAVAVACLVLVAALRFGTAVYGWCNGETANLTGQGCIQQGNGLGGGACNVDSQCPSNAAPVQVEQTQSPNCRVYYVYYRDCPQSPWVPYGGFSCRALAIEASQYLISAGYDAFYR